MFIGKFWQFTDSNKSEKVLFNLSLLPNIHPWCGRGHPGPGPQPGCISQHLALDRSRRDTAELPAKDTSERSQQLRCQDPRLPRHQVVSRHGNSHHVVLVWSVNSEIVNLMLDIQSQSINSRKMSIMRCSVECLVCWNCIMQWLQWPLCENPGANVPFLLPTCSSSERLLWTFSSWPCIVPTSSFLLNDSVLLPVKTFLGT